MTRARKTNFSRLFVIGVSLLLATTTGCALFEETDYGSFGDYGKIPVSYTHLTLPTKA